MSFPRLARCVALYTCALLVCRLACGQVTAGARGKISGKVMDPSGALIARAGLTLTRSADGVVQTLTTDAQGRFAVTVAVGDYDLAAAADGFMREHREVQVQGGSLLTVELTLAIAVKPEEVLAAVGEEGGGLDAGASTLRLGAKELKTFSDNDKVFQQEISALAGSLGPQLPEIYIDGFLDGHFPPKSSIREVRFNRNKYSAQFDSFGLRRVEIFTKPGGDTLHGAIKVAGNADVFNARNPFIAPEPGYHTLDFDGSLSGSLGKKTGFYAGAVYDDEQNNAAVNAVNTNGSLLSIAVPDPLTTTTDSVRLDHQFTANNFGNLRYEFNQVNQSNGGLMALTLPETAYNSGITTQTLQLADTQVLPPHTILETRFQYIRTRVNQEPVSGAASTVVQGSFLGGGSATQRLVDNQDRFEFQEYLSREQGAHYLRFGGRYRLLRDANLTTAKFNGQFIFPSLLNYQLTVNAPAGTDPRTNCAVNATGQVCGGASQFALTAGQPAATLVTGDLGLFAEDEWRVRPNLTLNFGMRFETQSAEPDHVDPAPRFAATWALSRHAQKIPFVVLRAGAGLFYERFDAKNILTSLHQDGIRQQSLIVSNPGFYCVTVDAACRGLPAFQTFAASTLSSVYRVDPNFRNAYDVDIGGSAEHSFGSKGQIAVDYLWQRGVHQSLSRNINAPLPGTYVPGAAATGTRPFGTAQNIYQFGSGGIQNYQIVFVSARLQPVKWLFTYLTYDIARNRANADGATAFAANPYNLALDYGRQNQFRAQLLYTGGTVTLPLGISANYFLSVQSGAPFDITTGTDLNGDSIYNDRPAFATDLSRASVVRTSYGNFDTVPLPGAVPIPVNYGNSPGFAFLELTLSRSFNVGPRPAAQAVAGKVAARPERPWALEFSADTANVFNRDNRGTPVGILSSPYFGHAITLNNPFTPNTAANRTVILQTTFSF